MEYESISSLKTAFEELKTHNQQLVETNTKLQEKIVFLEHEQALLKKMIFGARRERFIPKDANQLTLDLGDMTVKPEESEKQQITYTKEKSKRKGKPVRLELPSHLPRQVEEIIPDPLPENAQKIGETYTEILEYRPGKLYVKRYVRPRYTYLDDQQEKKFAIADLPTLPITQGKAGPCLLAHLLISKFEDHIPFYRWVKQLRREGIKIAESTVKGWFSASCNLLKPLHETLQARLLKATYLMADETPIPVQDSEKKGANHKGYHWVYRAPTELLVCFDYQPSRSREGPVGFLKGYQGTLQTDGYVAYECFAKRESIVLLACMAHARRYFDQALDNNEELASFMLKKIQKLYNLEREAKQAGLSYQQRYVLRQEKAVPILDEIQAWLYKQASEKDLSQSSIDIAIKYMLNLWPRLKKYVDDGRYEIDNNWVENSIRPVALGRKNYLFAGSHDAARNAAMIYSFLGTCKLNQINPLEWLTYTLEHIKECKVNQLEKLLPVKENFPDMIMKIEEPQKS